MGGDVFLENSPLQPANAFKTCFRLKQKLWNVTLKVFKQMSQKQKTKTECWYKTPSHLRSCPGLSPMKHLCLLLSQPFTKSYLLSVSNSRASCVHHGWSLHAHGPAMALLYFLTSPLLTLIKQEDTWTSWKVRGRENDCLYLGSTKDLP